MILLLMYSAYKLNTMVNFSDYKIRMQENENYFQHTDQWGAKNDFALAACVTAYDGSSEDIEDPSIGKLKFYMKGWASSGGDDYFVELDQRACTQDELLGKT